MKPMDITSKPFVYQGQWCMLNERVRVLLRNKFNIKPDENCKVDGGNKLISDGVSQGLLMQVFTAEKMQEYLRSEETDFAKLFDMTAEMANKEEELERTRNNMIIVEERIKAQKSILNDAQKLDEMKNRADILAVEVKRPEPEPVKVEAPIKKKPTKKVVVKKKKKANKRKEK